MLHAFSDWFIWSVCTSQVSCCFFLSLANRRFRQENKEIRRCGKVATALYRVQGPEGLFSPLFFLPPNRYRMFSANLFSSLNIVTKKTVSI